MVYLPESCCVPLHNSHLYRGRSFEGLYWGVATSLLCDSGKPRRGVWGLANNLSTPFLGNLEGQLQCAVWGKPKSEGEWGLGGNLSEGEWGLGDNLSEAEWGLGDNLSQGKWGLGDNLSEGEWGLAAFHNLSPLFLFLLASLSLSLRIVCHSFLRTRVPWHVPWHVPPPLYLVLNSEGGGVDSGYW